MTIAPGEAPGESMLLLTTVLPAPTLIVPVPAIVPVLLRPVAPLVVSVALFERLIVPAFALKLGIASVPPLTLSTPAGVLVNAAPCIVCVPGVVLLNMAWFTN